MLTSPTRAEQDREIRRHHKKIVANKHRRHRECEQYAQRQRELPSLDRYTWPEIIIVAILISAFVATWILGL